MAVYRLRQTLPDKTSPQRIPCILLIFFDAEIVRKTLNGLLPFSDRLDIIVVENASIHSPIIREIVIEFMKMGLVRRYFFFLDNITANAYDIILRREMDSSAHEFVMVSDGDFVPLDPGWIDEIVHVLRQYRDVYCISGSIDLENLPVKTFGQAALSWVPRPIADHDEYIEGLSGVLVQLYRGKDLTAMLEYLKLKRWKFVDRDLHKYCHDVRGMQWARTKRALFRHLTWDSYQDLNHPYTRFKLSVPLDELWYHDRQAAYIEIENAGDLRGLGHFSK